jgi:hypothetical protein
VLFAAGIGQFRAGGVVDGSANAPARTQLTIRGVDHSINLQPSCATEHEMQSDILHNSPAMNTLLDIFV